MTRTIDATLTAALAAGTGHPYLMGSIGYYNAGGGPAIHSQDITHYKLTGTTLEIEMAYTADIGGDQDAIWLERGVTIAGVNYTLTTGRFAIQSQHYQANGRQLIKGSLFPNTYYSADGHGTYKTVIDAFCTNFGKTAVYRDPAAAWLNYTFLPLNTNIVLDDANAFAALLRQKYLIFMADRGNEEILFYSCAPGLNQVADFTLSPRADFFVESSRHSSRKYVWRDELGAVHTSGLATYPIHNLGFMWSTAAAPAITTAPTRWQHTIRPDLRFLDGDIIAVTYGTASLKGFALVTEEYTAPDKGHSHPRWLTSITANEVFGNTSGGSMPSGLERVSNYAPLNTSTFDHLLTANESNLQAAMDRLDDHHHQTFGTHGMGAQLAAGATTVMSIFATGFLTAGAGNPIAKSGILKNLYVRISSAQPAGGTLTVKITCPAGSPTPIQVVIPAGAAAGTYSDLTNTFAYNTPDLIRLDLANSDPANPSAQLGMVSFDLVSN